MQINDELILQWEPKVQKMASSVVINGLERADLAQELRLSICKSASKYNPELNVSFHTYLHTSMVNTIRTLLTKAKNKNKTAITLVNLSNDDEKSINLDNFMVDSREYIEESNILNDLETLNFTNDEISFIKLRLYGYTNNEISIKLGISNSHKLLGQVKEKMLQYYVNSPKIQLKF